MSEHESLDALRSVRPRLEHDDETARSLRDRIVSREMDPQASAPRSRGIPRVVKLGVAGLAAASLAAAAFAFAPLGPAGAPGVLPTVSTAYAAVHQAVTRTLASVESGTILTHTEATWLDGRTEVGEATGLELSTIFKWNGEDVSLVLAGDDGGRSLYVGGRYYETVGGKLVHYADSDNGQDARVGAVWVAAAKRDVDGDRVTRIVDVLKDLVATVQGDGSTVYVGHATVGEIDTQYRDADGLPYISRPFIKVGDAATSVKVMITVGRDGLLKELTAAYTWDSADWVYTAEYKDLGSTSRIPAPDPDSVTESDGTRG